MSRHEAVTRKSTSSNDPNERLVPALLSLSKSTRALVGLKLIKLGFYNGQDELLFALVDGVPSSVSHLADELAVRPSTASKMLDRLVKAGLVERKTDRSDARRSMVQITSAGLEARILLEAMRAELEAELKPPAVQTPDNVVDTLVTLSAILKSRLNRRR
jgi:DNA-binding MarR family transcriptional regulator